MIREYYCDRTHDQVNRAYVDIGKFYWDILLLKLKVTRVLNAQTLLWVKVINCNIGNM